ncbi:MAG: hypothetical protein GY951_15925 [Psychromonas sp.]|nr:hypothetical protein [Psychromonas sp.]
MIYVIAMTDKKLAHHFSKAEIFSFYNEDKRAVAVYKNPALNHSGCAGKKLLIDLLKDRNCETIIVRKIGQKTLARLLDAGFNVVQGNTRHTVEMLIDSASVPQNLLTDPSQGVEKKNGCCGHH